MSAVEQAHSFISLAEEDLRVARALFGVSLRHAAFHAQQAAEKAAEALLTREGVPFGRTHNLGQLALRFPEAHPWRPKLLALDRVSPYGTVFRYPDDVTGRLPQPPDAERLASDLDEIARLIVEARVPISLPRRG